MKIHFYLPLAAITAASLVLGLAEVPFAAAAEKDDKNRRFEVVQPGKTLFEKSYNELTGEWANWLQKEPIATNPAFDTDGSFCDLNQEGKFWFLAGTFGGIADRVCEVPKGKAIFFPIFANISFAPEFPLPEDVCNADTLPEKVDRVRCDVNDDTAVAPFVDLDVTVDGESVTDLFAYRVQSPPDGFTFESGPLFEEFGFAQGDRFPAVVDGYWILLKPLPPGLHTVAFSEDGAFPPSSIPDGKPDSGANYTLIIVDDDDDDG